MKIRLIFGSLAIGLISTLLIIWLLVYPTLNVYANDKSQSNPGQVFSGEEEKKIGDDTKKADAKKTGCCENKCCDPSKEKPAADEKKSDDNSNEKKSGDSNQNSNSQNAKS